MTIPHKAMPNTPGKIVRFNLDSVGAYAPQGYRDLFTAAFSLLNTNIAVDLLGYEDMPSVLVLCDERAVSIADAWIKYIRQRFLPSEGESNRNEVVAAHSVHGVYELSKPQRMLSSGKGGEEPVVLANGAMSSSWSSVEAEFLSEITIDRKTGIHVYYVKKDGGYANKDDGYVKKNDGNSATIRRVQAAQKYFDIVLVAQDVLPFLDEEENVTVLKYVPRNQALGSKRHIPVYAYQELAELAKDKKRKPGVYSIEDTYGNAPLDALISNAMLVAAFASGEEHNPWDMVEFSSLSLKEKLSLISISAKRAGNGSLVGVVGTGFGFLAVATAGGAGLLPDTGEAAFQGIAMALGSGLISSGGYSAVAKFSRKGVQASKNYNKKFLENSSAQIYSSTANLIPLSESPVLLTAGVDFQDGRTLAPMRGLSTLAAGPAAEPESESKIGSTARIKSLSNASDSAEGSSAPFSEQNTILATQRQSGPRIPLSRAILVKRLSALTDRWMEYELNPLKSLDYPLMLDADCSQTRDFLMAIHNAQNLEAELDYGTVDLTDFRDAVLYAEETFMTAEGHAKKMRYAHLDAGQKKKIKDARPLVAMLNDEEASPHEKVSAYRKAGDFLEGILALPERPIMGLLEVAK